MPPLNSKLCQGPCLPYCSGRTTKIILFILVVILSIVVIILGMRLYNLDLDLHLNRTQLRRNNQEKNRIN